MLYSLCITYKCLYKNISLQHNNFSNFKNMQKDIKKKCLYIPPTCEVIKMEASNIMEASGNLEGFHYEGTLNGDEGDGPQNSGNRSAEEENNIIHYIKK